MSSVIFIHRLWRCVDHISLPFLADFWRCFVALLFKYQLCQLHLILNTHKTKPIFFNHLITTKSALSETILTRKGQQVELVSTFKQLEFLISDHLTFMSHLQRITEKLKLLLGLYYRKQSCFSFCLEQKSEESVFLPVIDYGDVLYMRFWGSLGSLGSLTHRCVLDCLCWVHATSGMFLFTEPVCRLTYLIFQTWNMEITFFILLTFLLKSKLNWEMTLLGFSAPAAWNNSDNQTTWLFINKCTQRHITRHFFNQIQTRKAHLGYPDVEIHRHMQR